METVDDETSAAAIDFMERQHDAGTPFFTWMNATRMHVRTHVRDEHRSPPGLTALTEYADGMVEHDDGDRQDPRRRSTTWASPTTPS